VASPRSHKTSVKLRILPQVKSRVLVFPGLPGCLIFIIADGVGRVGISSIIQVMSTPGLRSLGLDVALLGIDA
jgi:hypothetical protein